MKVKKIRVKVTYEVGFSNIEVPKEVFEQFLKAKKRDDEIEMHLYPQAEEWMVNNIRESDCFDWKAKIEQLIVPSD